MSLNIDSIDMDSSCESSLIGFFRTGSIFFKPSGSLSFAFGELKLPDWVEEKLGNINERPRNANPGKAWGAYNIKTALNMVDEKEEQKISLIIKPYSIETCYGYWVPMRYSKIIKSQLENKRIILEGELLKIRDEIEKRGVKNLVIDYKNYLNDAGEILEKHSINFYISSELSASLLGRYEKFIERIFAKINDENKRERLSTPLISAKMPEIWEDDLALEEFSYSFFEYISSNIEIKIPKVVKSIKDAIGIDGSSDVGEIQDKFREYFSAKNVKWSDEFWI